MWADNTTMGDMGGGGFMNDGGSDRASTQENRESKSSNLVTVSVATVARLTQPDGLFMFHQKVSNVKLIGIVRSVDHSRSHAKQVFIIADPMLDAQVQVDLVSSDIDDHALFSGDSSSSPAHIKPNTFVHVVGVPKIKPNPETQKDTVYILAYDIRPVTDANNIFSSMLESIRNARLLEKIKIRTDAGDQQDSTYQPSSMASEYHSAASRVGNGLASAGPSTNGAGAASGYTKNQDRIVKLLNDCHADEGMSIDGICSALPAINRDEVIRILEFLTNEGHAYNTVDDDHYKLTN